MIRVNSKREKKVRDAMLSDPIINGLLQQKTNYYNLSTTVAVFLNKNGSIEHIDKLKNDEVVKGINNQIEARQEQIIKEYSSM